MYLKQRIINSVLPNPQTLTIIVSLLATLGVFLELLGGIWDASSHAVRAPEQFWSIQHVVVYSGVSIVAASSILGFVMLHKKIHIGKNKDCNQDYHSRLHIADCCRIRRFHIS